MRLASDYKSGDIDKAEMTLRATKTIASSNSRNDFLRFDSKL